MPYAKGMNYLHFRQEPQWVQKTEVPSQIVDLFTKINP
jgi:hypothetical protein